MGGFGSGRRRGEKPVRRLVEDCLVLDVADILRARAGRLTWIDNETKERLLTLDYAVETQSPDAFGTVVQLRYHPDCRSDPVRHSVLLQRSRLHYGGRRWWLTCHASVDHTLCLRPVKKLYLPLRRHWFAFGQDINRHRPPFTVWPGYFACRRCHRLTYASQQLEHNWFYRQLNLPSFAIMGPWGIELRKGTVSAREGRNGYAEH